MELQIYKKPSLENAEKV